MGGSIEAATAIAAHITNVERSVSSKAVAKGKGGAFVTLFCNRERI